MECKHPRTYHFENSNPSSDDKIQQDISILENNTIVVTEKMDGENTSLTRNKCYPRSIDGKYHESRTYIKSKWASIKNEIPEGWRIVCENMYAKHSIHYHNLPDYVIGLFIFNEDNLCLNYDNTLEWFKLFDICPAKELYRGALNEAFKMFPKSLNLHLQEGFVIRNINSFNYEEFSKNVIKWVRPNHVQTDKHWLKSKLIKNGLKNGSII